MHKPLVAVIVGPTASGKTSLSIELAKKLGGEIVSADSMQIYKKMNIATAKPTTEEMSGIPHHLIDFLEPDDEFSVAKYKEAALGKIAEILRRDKLPIVVGGTGLYIDTLIYNTEFFDYDENPVRSELEKRAEKEGIEVLFEELKRIDPCTAKKLHINDSKRIIRALEVYLLTRKTISEQKEQSRLKQADYNWCIIGINASDRQFLYDRINLRVDMMIKGGLLDEAEEFFKSEISKTARQAIGYKELKPYFDGDISLDEAIEKLKMETRRYAKRQLTWFRRNDSIHWLNSDEMSSKELVEKSIEIIEENRR